MTVERSHRIDDEENALDAVRAWERRYNCDRFSLALAGRTPAEKFYQYTALDDCTRLRVLRLYPRLNQWSSLDFLRELREAFPFPIKPASRRFGLDRRTVRKPRAGTS